MPPDGRSGLRRTVSGEVSGDGPEPGRKGRIGLPSPAPARSAKLAVRPFGGGATGSARDSGS